MITPPQVFVSPDLHKKDLFKAYGVKMYLPNILFFFINYQWLKIGLYALLLGGSYALWTLGLKLYGPVRCVPVVFMIYFHIYIISIFFNFIFLGLKLHGPVRCARGVIYDLFIV